MKNFYKSKDNYINNNNLNQKRGLKKQKNKDIIKLKKSVFKNNKQKE